MRLWPEGGGVKRQRDHALVRAVQLEARLGEAMEQREQLRRELTVSQQALERVVDNALFAAGAAPIYHPEDKRFQPRPAEQQQAEARRAAQALTPQEWRRKVEEMDRTLAERDRRTQLADELRALAQERAGGGPAA